jgi:predicted short-subunit dehydrogenase-like oxidoreductase (DUF2520 family)
VIEAVPHLEIIGPGRAGLALGSLLVEAGAVGRLTCTGRRAAPPDHPLFRGSPPLANYRESASARDFVPDAVVIAVPDAAIRAVAAGLAGEELPTDTPVLHLSGALGSNELDSLASRGYPTGSLHPLAVLADDADASRLRGGWFAVEGAPAAAAVARLFVTAMRGRILPVDGEKKALYHASAVAASNFMVTLLAVAERWMVDAGVPRGDARPALAALAAGAVESVRRLGPEDALTGPVARGDADTVQRHLAQLSPPDRLLYSVLASSTITLARRRGLDPHAAGELARLLETTE